MDQVAVTAFFQTLVQGLLTGGLYALIGTGLSLIFGVMKVINFAHGDFLAIGMFISLALFRAFNLDPYLSLLVAAPLGFALGFLIQRVVLSRLGSRLEEGSMLATLGIGLIVSNTLLLTFGAQPQNINVAYATQTVQFAGVQVSIPLLVAGLGTLVVIAGLNALLYRTELGRAIRATAQNPLGAELQGVKTTTIQAIVFGLGVAFAAIAGVLLMPLLYAYPTVGENYTTKAFIVTVLGVGAYTMTLLATPERVPAFLGGPVAPWWGALIGMLIATLIAAVWGGLTFRLRGSYFTLSTIAVALVLRLIAINSEWTGGSEGLFMPELPRFLGLDLFDRKAEYWLALAFLALTLLITHLIRRSRLGYALQAVREDEDGARALGIDPTRMKVVAFMISAALTALGGSLYALYLQAFEPHTLLEMPISIQIALMAIIGGRGSIQGPVIGALLIATLGELFRNVFSNANLLIYGVLILVVTLFAPGGIMGLFDRKSSKLGTAR